MIWNPDPVLFVNLTLCVIILALGIYEYIRTRARLELYVGIAFGLFGVSHLLTLIGLAPSLSIFLIVIRLLAYLLVIYALYIAIAKKKNNA